jgi:hypothetical protein
MDQERQALLHRPVERHGESERDWGLTDNLQHGVRSGGFALDLNGQDAEQQDLDGCARSIPACPTHSALVH